MPKKKCVFVVGRNPVVTKMFSNEGWRVVGRPVLSDALCFTGGADIQTDLYGEKAVVPVYTDPERDRREVQLYEKYLYKKGMIGICRGGQLLNVLSGGSMYQDVDNHTCLGTHRAKCTKTGEVLHVTSTHHQMMDPSPEGEVLLTAELSEYRVTEWYTHTAPYLTDKDTEAVWYPKNKSFCFQPHPEYTHGKHCRPYFFKTINHYLFGENQG